MPHPLAKVHRMFELVEPIATVTFSEVPNEAFLALGMRNYWDGYFAGRAAPLGLAPAGVVHAVFYNFADGEVTVVARTHEVGESQESMPVAYSGEPLEIGFNAEFLKEGLESVEGDDVKMKLISPLRPAILTDEADDFTYLVMPIRLPG